MPIISINNLNISTTNKTLVSDVSFSIEKSEILALVGESGSGKTITALSIVDLLPKSLSCHCETAKQSWQSQANKTKEIAKNSTSFCNDGLVRGKDVGMIFQEPMTSLNPLHTIGKQIGEAIRIHQSLNKYAINAKIIELLNAVELGHFASRLNAYPHQLSGGERQRVMIAMAIANNPKLLIADEPTTALDVTIQAQILKLLEKLKNELGMSVLLITHDLSIVRKIADRVAIMQKGKIVEIGRTLEIMNNPKNDYTKKLLASEPKNNLQAAPENAPIIMECKNLSVEITSNNGILAWKKSYKNILTNINLSLKTGSTLGIVGESGSGKTTLALALLKLIKSKGEILFLSERIDTKSGNDLRKLRKNMQVVFQDPYSSLNPRMTIAEIISEGLEVHEPNLTPQECDQKVDDILQEVGLSPDMKLRYPHEFSGGQRQRISIARALILKPKLIILDEPTSALDISVQAQILDLLKDLQQKYNLSYIFISHDLRTIRAISHYIFVLQKGLVVEQGVTREIFNNPKQEYTKTLLAAAM